MFSLAVRSGGKVEELEDALSALALGHALLRLGELAAQDELADTSRDVIRKTLHLIQRDPQDHEQVRQDMRRQADRIIRNDDQTTRLSWLLEVVAREFQQRGV